mgnify:CR=1 FL=1
MLFAAAAGKESPLPSPKHNQPFGFGRRQKRDFQQPASHVAGFASGIFRQATLIRLSGLIQQIDAQRL